MSEPKEYTAAVDAGDERIMSITQTIRLLSRRSGVRLQYADIDDLSSEVTLEVIATSAPVRRAVNRVWMRYYRGLAKRPLPLTIDISTATCPRDYMGAR